MFIKIFFLLLIFQIISPDFLIAQRNLERGNRLFDMNMFEEAMVYFQKEIEAEVTKEIKYESMQQLANCYRLLGRFEEAEETYKSIFKIKKREPKNVLNYAHALKSSAKYGEALDEYTQYAKMNPDDPMGDIYVESCRLAQQWLDEPLKIEARNYTSVNTIAPDFAPAVYENGIILCSSREGSKKRFISINGNNEETLLDFYFADTKIDGSLPVPYNKLNSYYHEGPASFSGDGKKVYFTRTIEGKRDKEKNRVLSTLQIFYSEKESSGKWSTPVSALPFNSTEYSVGHPSLSTDGKSLYFMSDMPGSAGTDIYVTKKQQDGEWGPAQNLGKQINTFGFEVFPYIHGNTLYFSSNTHPGMGKLDIFCVKNVNGNWVNLTNLKPPLNSIADDFGIVVDSSINRGFFSSNRFNGLGSDDIYSFVEIVPLRLSFDGKYLHIEDQSLFDALKFKLLNGSSEEQQFGLENNLYSFHLLPDTIYTLVARKEGFSYNKIKLKLSGKDSEGESKIEISPSLKPVVVNGILRSQSESPAVSSDPGKQSRVLPETILSLHKNNSRIEQATTNIQGEYAFNSSLEAGGSYSINFKELSRKEEMEASKPGMEEGNNGSAPVRFYGKIKSSGLKLDNSLVLLLKEGDVVDEVITDENGNYTFEASPNSSYTIVASKGGYFDNYIKLSPAEIKAGKLDNELVLLKKEMITIKGMAKDEDGNPMLNSPVTLSKGATVLAKRLTNEKGEFEFLALKDGDYSITITQKGFMQKDIPVTTVGENVENPIILETKVEKISTGAKEQTLSIYYDYNSADLQAASIPALNKLISFLKQNPTLKIEISSHTDSRGTDEYNLTLSQKRAESVVLFLYFDGEISRERMTAKGYGETKLVNQCANGTQCSDEDHARNRRTELKVLSF